MFRHKYFIYKDRKRNRFYIKISFWWSPWFKRKLEYNLFFSIREMINYSFITTNSFATKEMAWSFAEKFARKGRDVFLDIPHKDELVYQGRLP